MSLLAKVMNTEQAYFEVQGDPNQNCPFLRAITQKVGTSDPMLVKPKCV